MTTTSEVVADYRENGFLVVADLFTPQELDLLRSELVAFVDGTYEVENPRVGGDPASRLDGLLAVNFPHRRSRRILDTARDERLLDLVSTLAGAHLDDWDGAVKLVQSMLYHKPRGHLGQPWHQDEAFVPTRDRTLTAVWIALEDAVADNGCLRVIPGSHRHGFLHPTRVHAEGHYQRTDEAVGLDADAAVPLELSAGSAVVFNGYLLHASSTNRSSRSRDALVFHYASSWSLIPWSPDGRPVEGQLIGQLDYPDVIPLTGDPYGHRDLPPSHDGVVLRPYNGA